MAGNDHAMCKEEYGVAASWEFIGSGMRAGFAPCPISSSLGSRPAPVWSRVFLVRCHSITIACFGIRALPHAKSRDCIAMRLPGPEVMRGRGRNTEFGAVDISLLAVVVERPRLTMGRVWAVWSHCLLLAVSPQQESPTEAIVSPGSPR